MRARLGFATLAAALVLPVTAAPAQATDTYITSMSGNTVSGSQPTVELWNEAYTDADCLDSQAASVDQATITRVPGPSAPPMSTGSVRFQPKADGVVSGLSIAPVNVAGGPVEFWARVQAKVVAGSEPWSVDLSFWVENTDGTFALGVSENHPVGDWSLLLSDNSLEWYHETEGPLGWKSLTEYLAGHPEAKTVETEISTGDWDCAGNRVELYVDELGISGGGNSQHIDFEPAPPCGGKTVTVDLSAGQQATAGPDVIMGTTGNDVINGFGGDDTICGGAGDDVLQGGPGNDALIGGPGSNTASYSAAAAAVNASLRQGSATGSATGQDSLNGIQHLAGSSYNDTLAGNGLDNRLVGGAGVDTVTYASSPAAVSASLSSTGMQYVGNGNGNDLLSSVENLVGSPYADILGGNAAANALDGGHGNDHLGGQEGNDVLLGRAGADTLQGGPGNDDLHGAEGPDRVLYKEARAPVHVSLATVARQNTGTYTGSDLITGVENATGGAHPDVLIGNGLANLLEGSAGNDVLYDGAGNDTLVGGAGNDTLQSTAGDDVLKGVDGIDTVTYASATTGVRASLALTGRQNTGSSTGYDTLATVERILGSNYADVLTGNGGANHLDGRSGSDTCHGGAGSDTKASCERFTGFP